MHRRGYKQAGFCLQATEMALWQHFFVIFTCKHLVMKVVKSNKQLGWYCIL